MIRYQSITDKIFNNLFDDYFLVLYVDQTKLDNTIVEIEDFDKDGKVFVFPNKLRNILQPLDFYVFDNTLMDYDTICKQDFILWLDSNLNLNIPTELREDFGTNRKYFRFKNGEDKYLWALTLEEKETILNELDIAFEYYKNTLLKAKQEYFKELENAKINDQKDIAF